MNARMLTLAAALTRAAAKSRTIRFIGDIAILSGTANQTNPIEF
jgi:hypothetical protein